MDAEEARYAHDKLDYALEDIRDVVDSLDGVGDGGRAASYVENAIKSLYYAMDELRKLF